MQAIKNLGELFRVSPDLSQYTWEEARNKYGENVMPFVMFLQFTLVPLHILTTDYLDESTRFSAISLGFRFGAVFLFILTYFLVKKTKIHSDYYYGITFFINAMSDAYISIYSSEGNIVTHMLGYGVVMIGYSILTPMPLIVYNSIMLVSTIYLFVLYYFFSDIDFRIFLENGGAFVLFFIFICPIFNLFRYTSFRNDFFSLKKMNELNSKLLQKQEELQQQQEEILVQKEALAAVNELLDKKNRDMTASITYASRMQKGILPAIENLKKYFPDSFILFQPRDIVSGDFYWFEKGDNKLILAAADCTGHGVPGALMSMIGNEILRQIVVQRGITQADEILNELNRGIHKALRQDVSKNTDGMDIALVVIDKQNKVMEFAGAKNPLYYIQNQEFHQVKADSYSIGGEQTKGAKVFTKQRIDISIPITFYIGSDGFQDQFGGEHNKKFMVKRLRELLFSIHDKEMSEQKEILEKTIADWMRQGKMHQTDDILWIGARLYACA